MKVTEEMIVQINELYLERKTYAAVSRIVGVAPTTVKRYVNPNFKKVTIEEKTEMVIEEKEINYELFLMRETWDILLELMPREVKGIEEIRREVYL